MIISKNKISSIKESDPNFDWDLYGDRGTRKKENKKVKKHSGDNSIIFSSASYSQQLYEFYTGREVKLSPPEMNKVVLGKVTSVGKTYAMVDINWREDAILKISKEDPIYLKYIKPDYPIEVIVEDIKKSSGTQTVYVSYTKNMSIKKKDEIIDSIGNNIGYLCTVKELVHAGYFVDIEGVTCFMPGSLAGMNKLINFESLVGQQIYVVPVNYSKEKDYIVVSHREYLKSLIPSEMEKLEPNKKYTGFVTGCSKHGIFVEFNACLTGLISKNDISDELLKVFENRQIKPGDEIDFYVIDVFEDGRINLSQTQKENTYSAWDNIEDKYKIDSVISGKIKRIVNYGLFIEIEPKVVGLLHKSNLTEDVEFTVGQEIEVQLIKIDKQSKKLDFAMCH